MSKERMETYKVECNCGMCMALRDSMGQSCRGCGVRHNEVIDLTAERDQLVEGARLSDVTILNLSRDNKELREQLTTVEEAFKEIIKDRPWMDTKDLVDEIFAIVNAALTELGESDGT